MQKKLENKGQIFTQLVKIFSFAVGRKFSLLLSRSLFNGRNTKAMCASRRSVSGQFLTFPTSFLSGRMLFRRLSVKLEDHLLSLVHCYEFNTITTTLHTWIPDPRDVKYQLDQRDR